MCHLVHEKFLIDDDQDHYLDCFVAQIHPIKGSLYGRGQMILTALVKMCKMRESAPRMFWGWNSPLCSRLCAPLKSSKWVLCTGVKFNARLEGMMESYCHQQYQAPQMRRGETKSMFPFHTGWWSMTGAEGTWCLQKHPVWLPLFSCSESDVVSLHTSIQCSSGW